VLTETSRRTDTLHSGICHPRGGTGAGRQLWQPSLSCVIRSLGH